jgi:hypothetical protein
MPWATRGEKPATPQMLYFLSDSQGLMLAMSTPQAGQHHDVFQIQTRFDEICVVLKAADINLKGLFLNADPGFDSADFVTACEKEEFLVNVVKNNR